MVVVALATPSWQPPALSQLIDTLQIHCWVKSRGCQAASKIYCLLQMCAERRFRPSTVELPEESAAIVEDISSSILGSGPLPAESAEVAKTVLLPERMLPRVETARQDPRFADITVGFILGGPDKRRSLSVLRGDMLYVPGGQSTDAPHTCGRLDALLEENHSRIVGWIRSAPATSSRVFSQRDRSLQLSLQTREPLAFLAALFGPEVQFLRLDTRLGLSRTASSSKHARSAIRREANVGSGG